MANNKVQMVGDQSDLSKGPGDMRQSSFHGGTVQMTGSESDLSQRTNPMGNFDKGISGGRVEMTGDGTPMNRTPMRGWESYDTPISDNSRNEQESVSGYPSPGRRG